jgi:hypothetical protein
MTTPAIPCARDEARQLEVRRNGQSRPYELEDSGLDTTRGRLYGMSSRSTRHVAQANDPFAPQGTKGTPPLTTPDAYISCRLIGRRRAPALSRNPLSTIPLLLSNSTHLQRLATQRPQTGTAFALLNPSAAYKNS